MVDGIDQTGGRKKTDIGYTTGSPSQHLLQPRLNRYVSSSIAFFWLFNTYNIYTFIYSFIYYLFSSRLFIICLFIYYFAVWTLLFFYVNYCSVFFIFNLKTYFVTFFFFIFVNIIFTIIIYFNSIITVDLIIWPLFVTRNLSRSMYN